MNIQSMNDRGLQVEAFCTAVLAGTSQTTYFICSLTQLRPSFSGTRCCVQLQIQGWKCWAKAARTEQTKFNETRNCLFQVFGGDNYSNHANSHDFDGVCDGWKITAIKLWFKLNMKKINWKSPCKHTISGIMLHYAVLTALQWPENYHVTETSTLKWK